MAYESTPPRVKTRSASISAPTSGSLETILNPPSSNGTPEIGYQRRRPATRTQSARITGARSVSKSIRVISIQYKRWKTHFAPNFISSKKKYRLLQEKMHEKPLSDRTIHVTFHSWLNFPSVCFRWMKWILRSDK